MSASFVFLNAGIVALSAVPALLNLAMLAFVIRKLPRNALVNTFSLTIVGLIGWQISDTVLRLVQTPEVAQTWHYALLPSVLLVTSAGLHFTLLFTNKIKRGNFMVPALIYIPMVGYDLLNKVNVAIIPVKYNETWGYVQSTDINWVGFLELGHAVLYAFLIIFLLGHYALKMESWEKTLFKQTILILIGFLVPTIQGSITQFAFPHILGLADIPLTSTTMSAFTISIFIALWRYNLFTFEPEYEANKILATMHDGLCVVDENNRIKFTNHRTCEMLGYSDNELMNRDLFDFLHPANYKAEVEQLVINRAIDKDDEYYLRFLTKDGESLFTNVRDTPMVNYRGEVIGWINVLTDISKLEDTMLKLKNKNKELSTFFHRTSHDLRGPLAGILGLIALSKNKKNPETEKWEILEMMDQKAQELDQTLGQLIKIAEINDNSPKPEYVNLEKLVKEVIQEIAMEKPGIECETTKSFKPKSIKTDRFYLKSILQNLVSNSFQFSQSEKLHIVVSGRMENQHYILEVADNGPGITPAMQPLVFNMFVRGDRDRSGSGLGLYLAKIAVEKLDGEIALDSDGTGTKITLILPELSSGKRPRVLE